jgi:signal transduction histidine kinase
MTTKRGQGGTGLGLAISRRIVNASDGDIAVHSKPGEGAEFSVSLPRAHVGRDVMPNVSDASLHSG